jgi:hypothetical protein
VDQQQQQQPQWSPPPQQPTGWGGPGTMGPIARPLGVTLSSIWFYFIGVLALLAAVLVLAGSTMLESAFGGSAGGVFAGVGIVFAVIIGLIAVLYILAGWGTWTGRGWGRVLGIILAILGVLFGLSALTGGSTVYGIAMIVIWALVIYALWMASAFFAARR